MLPRHWLKPINQAVSVRRRKGARVGAVRAQLDGQSTKHVQLFDSCQDRLSITAVVDAADAALADPKMKARLGDPGGTVLTGSPADFGKLIADETEKWAKVIKFAGIKADLTRLSRIINVSFCTCVHEEANSRDKHTLTATTNEQFPINCFVSLSPALMYHCGNGPDPSIVNRPESLPPQLPVYSRDFGTDRLNSRR
jgi:hypothetical protein